MKKILNRKALLIALSITLVIALTVGGTLAWLMAKGNTVVNNFNTYKVAVSVTETTGQDFHIMPGTSEAKDPKVTVTTDMPAYVFIVKDDNTNGLVSYEIADGWTLVTGESNVYYRVVEPTLGTLTEYNLNVLKDDVVSYDGSITSDSIDTALAALGTGETFHLSFTPYAIQKTGFDTAQAAWAQIKTDYSL